MIMAKTSPFARKTNGTKGKSTINELQFSPPLSPTILYCNSVVNSYIPAFVYVIMCSALLCPATSMETFKMLRKQSQSSFT